MSAHPRWTRLWFDDADLDDIAAALCAAEKRTSGEIRLHLERRLPRHRDGRPVDPLERARHVFARLEMHRTEHHHGVLVYLALEDHKLAVVGDAGIHAHVGDEYWARVRDLMVERLRGGAPPREAILAAIDEIARVLAAHFPRAAADHGMAGGLTTG